MKKHLLSLLLALILISPVFGDVTKTEATHRTSLSLIGLPTLSWAHTNEKDQIMGYNGINLALGFSSLNYIKPQKLNNINAYVHWGTVMLLLPYMGAGVEYTMSNGFYAAIETVYLVPTFKAGLRFMSPSVENKYDSPPPQQQNNMAISLSYGNHNSYNVHINTQTVTTKLSWSHTNKKGQIKGYNNLDLYLCLSPLQHHDYRFKPIIGYSSLTYFWPQKMNSVNIYTHGGIALASNQLNVHTIFFHYGVGIEYTLSNGFYAAIETYSFTRINPFIKTGIKF